MGKCIIGDSSVQLSEFSDSSIIPRGNCSGLHLPFLGDWYQTIFLLISESRSLKIDMVDHSPPCLWVCVQPVDRIYTDYNEFCICLKFDMTSCIRRRVNYDMDDQHKMAELQVQLEDLQSQNKKLITLLHESNKKLQFQQRLSELFDNPSHTMEKNVGSWSI